MPRPTPRLLVRQLPKLTSSHSFTTPSPAIYSIGISYAGKDSPPFATPSSTLPRSGFANVGHGMREAWHIRDWVREMLSQRAGRGELSGEMAGGWKEGIQEQVRKWGAGEDFFAIVNKTNDQVRRDSPSSDTATHLAISDGVGGWADVVDPSFFSQALMYHYSTSLKSSPGLEPWQHLDRAYKKVEKEKGVVAGGSTACAVSMDTTGYLCGVNLGDSGCSILRNGQIAFSTPSLTHYFNCPKQLAKIPPTMAKSGVAMDLPESASDTFTAQLQPGDIVVLYTDGLSDNVPSTHLPLLLARISDILLQTDNAHLSPLDQSQELARLYADVLVAYGRMAMTRTGQEVEEVNGEVRPGWKTPFEVEAAKEGLRYEGGKVDDITVMTAVVSERNAEDD